MAEMNPEQQSLAEQAEALKAAIDEAEIAVEQKHQERVRLMQAMRDQGMSWAAVGRAFGVTPQAAMYATGAAVRTPKPLRRKPSSNA